MDFTENCNSGYNEYLHMMNSYWTYPKSSSIEMQKEILGTNGVKV